MAFKNGQGAWPAQLRLAMTATAGLLLGGTAWANTGYTVQSLQLPYAEFVPEGDIVAVRVTGPSAAALAQVSIRRNGSDVTAAFAPDGQGALLGSVGGLQAGANRIEVFAPASRAGRAAGNPTAAPRALAGVTVAAGINPQLDCAGLLGLQLPPEMLEAPSDVASITLAVQENASTSLPAHCRVRGQINPRIGVNNTPFAIGFELRMPLRWSGRFFFQGGGGNDGNIGNAGGSTQNGGAPALARGMAAVSTDGGHTGGAGSAFGFDPQARIDHAYNAYGKTAATAKALLDLYYGRVPQKSYFIGCSGGGRQGMMFTQRYPAAFDGVVAVAPAMRVATGASISAAWESITYRSVAPLNGQGQPILSQAFTNGDLSLVANRVLQQCDALDGRADGIVHNHKACNFDPQVLQCPGAKDDTCLSAAQVEAMRKGFAGPVNSQGERLYYPWAYDPGLAAGGWRAWKLGSSTTATPNSAFVSLIQDAMRWEFLTPHDPSFDIFSFNFDTDPARLQAFGALYNTGDDVRLIPYRARGGKLMLLNGLSDPIFSALETADYVDRAIARNGEDRTADYMRLFLVPGMNHCSGGPATDRFDNLTNLIDWVENERAPERITATGPSFPGQSRPLCRYPNYAHYDGSGDPTQAASYICSRPASP